MANSCFELPSRQWGREKPVCYKRLSGQNRLSLKEMTAKDVHQAESMVGSESQVEREDIHGVTV